MGTFNFSNMQGGQQQETQNIPREFRPAVEIGRASCRERV